MEVTEEITQRAQELLEAIRTANGWVDRVEIAALVGKHRLTPFEVELLGRLVRADLLEVGEELRGITTAYQYRAK